MGSTHSKKEHPDRVFVDESLNSINVNEGCLNLDEELNIAERIFGVEYEKIIDRIFVTHVTVGRQWSWPTVDYVYFVILKTNCGVLISLDKHQAFTSIEFRRKLYRTDGYGFEVYDVIEDSKSSYPFSCLIDLLKEMFITFSASNNQDFAKIIFDEISQEGYFKLNPHLNVAERVFGYNYKSIVNDTTVTHVYVYKCPLEGICRSSAASIRERIGRQWTSVDYHAFVVLETSRGVCLSLEKQQDGIYIGRSIRYDEVVDGMRSSPRKGPVNLEIEDSSDYPFIHFLGYLDAIVENCSDYSVTDQNCQDFAKRIFDKIASTKTWNYTRPKEYLYKTAIIFGIQFFIMHLWS